MHQSLSQLTCSNGDHLNSLGRSDSANKGAQSLAHCVSLPWAPPTSRQCTLKVGYRRPPCRCTRPHISLLESSGFRRVFLMLWVQAILLFYLLLSPPRSHLNLKLYVSWSVIQTLVTHFYHEMKRVSSIFLLQYDLHVTWNRLPFSKMLHQERIPLEP